MQPRGKGAALARFLHVAKKMQASLDLTAYDLGFRATASEPALFEERA